MNFPYSKWLDLPIGTRAKISESFKIDKVRSTHVSNNVIVDDGYNVRDVEKVLNRKFIEDYVGFSTEDSEDLWKSFIDKVEGREVNITVAEVLEPVAVIVSTPVSRNNTTMKSKKSKKNE